MIADMYIKEGTISRMMMPWKIDKYNRQTNSRVQSFADLIKQHQNRGMQRLIQECKKIDDLKYLKMDLQEVKQTIKTIRERIVECKQLGKCKETAKYYDNIQKMFINKGITEKDCDATLKWCDDCIEICNQRIKELRSQNESCEIVTEAYVGKESIEKLHSIFCTMRDECIEKRKQPSNNRLREFEAEVENFFGFKAFDFDIDPSMSINAFTYPVVSSWDFSGSEYIETTKNGYRLKKSCGLVAISRITKGLFYNKNITNDECFAIFLHEIGHSFVNRSEFMEATEEQVRNMALYNAILLAIINPATIPVQAYNIIRDMNWYKNIAISVNRTLRSMKIMRKFDWTMNGLIEAIFGILNKFLNTTAKLTGVGLLSNKLSLFLAEHLPIATPDRGRSAERLSDDFAKVYGYGAELSSGLLKLNIESYDLYDSKLIKKIPFIKNWFDYQDDIAQQCIDLFDVHPSNIDRILSVRQAMEDDLKSADVSPKVKKELKENLKAMDELIDDLKNTRGIMEKDPNTYRQARAKLQIAAGRKLTNDEKEYISSDNLNKDFNDRMVKENIDSLLEEYILEFGDLDDIE